MIAMVAMVVAPWFADTTTYGFHDWDVVTSFRYLSKISLLEYGEFPGWNPYACGGYPSWGYVEGASNVVSPWLPAYLWLPLPLAIRVETVGMALLGAFGAYAAASCFTRSHGARLLVAVLWAVNGRWGLQVAAGHTWHLAYAYLPWCMFFFDKAMRRQSRLRHLVGLGVGFAMMVYAGGIYPLPHTVLALGAYASILALAKRSTRPLELLAIGGLIGIGLSAPKLLPMLDTFAADPRLITSNESLSPGAFVTLLTSPDQSFFSRPARVTPYGWHEWGMYISSAGLGTLAAGFVLATGRRQQALKIVGALFVILGFGAFHPSAPWSLMHQHLPVFRSQHVPSRFLYPAVLLLALVAAAAFGGVVDKRRRRMPWLDLVLALAVSVMAFDIARISQLPMSASMWMVAPDIPQGGSFHFEVNPPYQYKKRDWAGPMLLSMMANTGVLNCYGIPREKNDKPKALSRRDRRYRGEAFLRDGAPVSIASWSPNGLRVTFEPKDAPRTLTYNMHHRNGWSAEASSRAGAGEARVVERHGLITVELPSGTSEVGLRYRPPGLRSGLAICALTVVALLGLWRVRREEDQ
jgi:hypothetical protein